MAVCPIHPIRSARIPPGDIPERWPRSAFGRLVTRPVQWFATMMTTDRPRTHLMLSFVLLPVQAWPCTLLFPWRWTYARVSVLAERQLRSELADACQPIPTATIPHERIG
jgi:hypothetical protein